MKRFKYMGLVLLFIAVLAWFAVIRPQIASFSENSLQARARSTEVASYQKRLDDLKQIKQQGSAVQSTLNALYLAMPRESQIPEVLVMMESIGANTGVTFTAFNVGSPTGDEVPVSVSFGGSLSSLSSFINGLSQNVRTAQIKSQSLSADENGNLSITMQIGLIYQGER
jgi:Tfp pilus assembly protein PilO